MSYGIIKSLENIIRNIAKVSASAGCVSLIVMAVVTTVDVVGRNLFDAPMS